MPAENLLWGRVSEEEQAQWTVRGIAYARENWPWAGVFSIWYLRQVGDIPRTDSRYYFRMVNVDFTPLPVYSAVQEAAKALATASPGWYEETAAPVQYQGQWLSICSGDASGGSYAASNEPGSQMALTFLGTDLRLRVRQGPDGGRLLVAVDGVSGRGTNLPRNAFNQAYLDLYSPREEWVEVTLVEGLDRELPPQPHRLEMTVAGDKDPESQGHFCALDALEVDYQRSYLVFWAAAGLLCAGTVAALSGLVLEICRPPARRAKRTPLNPWTVRPEQMGPSEDHSSTGVTPPDQPSLPPSQRT
jgi:hypothetical protein